MDASPYACFHCKGCSQRLSIVEGGLDRLGFQPVICRHQGCRNEGKEFFVCHTCFVHGTSVSCIAYNARFKHIKYDIHVSAKQLQALTQQILGSQNSCLGQVETSPCSQRLDELMNKHFKATGPDAYFRHEICQPGSGIPFLVLQSSFTKCFQENVDTILPKDAMLDFETAHALNNLTHSERDAVQKLVKQWYELGRRHMKEDVCKSTRPQHRRILPPANNKEMARA